MQVHLNCKRLKVPISRRFLEKRIEKILHLLKLPQAILSVSLVDDAFIAELNERYRGKKGPTDVLSFPMEEEDLLGDVVVSLDTAQIQAREKKLKLEEEVLILLVHGILHLLGYDHMKKKEAMEMQRMEKKLWEELQK